MADADVYEFLECDMENVDAAKLEELEKYEKRGTYPPRFELMYQTNGATAELQPAKIFINAETDSEIAFQYNLSLGTIVQQINSFIYKSHFIESQSTGSENMPGAMGKFSLLIIANIGIYKYFI